MKSLAILCGGRSSRLGTDKGLYKPLGDESLVERQIRILGDGFDRILVVLRDKDQASLYKQSVSKKVIFLCDEDSPNSPPNSAAAGVATAIANSPDGDLFILPVDQLGVRLRHLRELSIQDKGYFESSTGDIHPFPIRLQPADKDRMLRQLESGLRSIRTLVSETGLKAVSSLHWDQAFQVNGNTREDIHRYLGGALSDGKGRRMHYLRFSLTEACNLSCTYCLPEGYPEWYRHRAKVDVQQIQVILEGFRHLGFRKVRFTGGEPTVHPGCLDAVRMASDLGYEYIAMTTNGLLIKNLPLWHRFGLDQINISLDSLRPETFEKITKSSGHGKVLGLIDDALAVGMKVKVNVVLMSSINGHEVKDWLEWVRTRPVTVRFIELMPTHLNQNFSEEERVSNYDLQRLARDFGFQPEAVSQGIDLGGPEVRWVSPDAQGTLGFISPLSCNFCDACNRLRITARGRLRLCLFGDADHELPLGGAHQLAARVRQLLIAKQEGHELLGKKYGNVSTFRTIGG